MKNADLGEVIMGVIILVFFLTGICIFSLSGCTIGTTHNVTVNEYPCDGADTIKSSNIHYNTNIIFNSDTIKTQTKTKQK